VKITIKNLQKKIPIYPTRIKKAIRKLISGECKIKSGEIAIYFVNDKKISELNNKYLKKNMPTDVLAFDLSEPKKNYLLADIFISGDTAARNAEIFKTTADYEIKLYCIHAFLHLLGFNDFKPRERKIMRKKENQYAHP
jgi:probable rRNA maturation factor